MYIKLLLIIILLYLLFNNIESFENNNKVYVSCMNDYVVRENDIKETDIYSVNLTDSGVCDNLKLDGYEYFPKQEILSCQKLNSVSGHCNQTNQLDYPIHSIYDLNDDMYHKYHLYDDNYKVLYDIETTNKILTDKGVEVRDSINTSGVFSILPLI